MKIFKNINIQDTNNQWLIASVIIPVLAIIITILIHLFSRPVEESKFVITNSILKSDATLIIKANNKKANQNKHLDIMFDEVSFPQKGILYTPDSKGMNTWCFTLKKYTSVNQLTKDGEHSIKMGFSDSKWSEEFGIIFLTKPPIVRLEKSHVEGRVNIKGDVATELQIPKNILSVNITYFNDDQSCTIKNIPLETKIHPETGITYYVFETVLQGLPIFNQDDIRYLNPFWKVEVKDQAGNNYFHEQSYAKFIAPGSDVVGVGSIANIKIEKISEDISRQLKNIVRIVPNPILIDNLPNGKPPIDLTVRSQGSKTKLEWNYNIDSISPLTLIYKNEKQIGASATNEYIENSIEPTAQFRVEQELNNKIYSSITKSIESYNYQLKSPPDNIQYYFLIDKSQSMWAHCNPDDKNEINFFEYSKELTYKILQSIFKLKSNSNVYLFTMDSNSKYYGQIQSANEAKKILDLIRPGGASTIGDSIERIRKHIVENSELTLFHLYLISDMDETKVGKLSKQEAIIQLLNTLKLKEISIQFRIYSIQCIDNKVSFSLKNNIRR